MNDKYLESSIYSFKKAISEYNNLFEIERLNQFATNIHQAFNKIFIYHAINNNWDYKLLNGKVKSFDQLSKAMKSRNEISKIEFTILSKLNEIRNKFQHNINDFESINNSFLLVSALVFVYKKILRKTKPKIVNQFNLIGINSYKWIESDNDFSKWLFKFYRNHSFVDYSYEIPIITSIKGFDKFINSNKKFDSKIINHKMGKVYHIDDGKKATEMVKSITSNFPKFKTPIFTHIKGVLGIVNENFKSPLYGEVPDQKINNKYVLRFKNLITYKDELEKLIIEMILVNGFSNVKTFFKSNYDKKIILRPQKIIENKHILPND